jgi:hypothetical protein
MNPVHITTHATFRLEMLSRKPHFELLVQIMAVKFGTILAGIILFICYKKGFTPYKFYSSIRNFEFRNFINLIGNRLLRRPPPPPNMQLATLLRGADAHRVIEILANLEHPPATQASAPPTATPPSVEVPPQTEALPLHPMAPKTVAVQAFHKIKIEQTNTQLFVKGDNKTLLSISPNYIVIKSYCSLSQFHINSSRLLYQI